ncbi:GLABROUS1 enhancer-binding protein-like [Vicia villosa]|uniref:GLABROUS1 enhancer-binding protein-like n=1 Tax=Vicia villosa TaxID=3911 RepID=UPI00273CF16B|nr:GLABROUS1 enhancer-binding protein-like [Vicia villosa]
MAIKKHRLSLLEEPPSTSFLEEDSSKDSFEEAEEAQAKNHPPIAFKNPPPSTSNSNSKPPPSSESESGSDSEFKIDYESEPRPTPLAKPLALKPLASKLLKCLKKKVNETEDCGFDGEKEAEMGRESNKKMSAQRLFKEEDELAILKV